jgi:hypothetical protein
MGFSTRLAAAGLVLTSLVACGSPTPHQPKDQDDADASADVDARQGTRDETVFDDTIRTQDRARAVEGVTLQSKANLDEAIEQSSEGGKPKDE